MSAPPSVLVSHGAPTLILERAPARDFLAGLGATLGRPEAILCVSAHWETAEPAVSTAERPGTIHDFYGFPEALYRLHYPAPGASALARRAAGLLAGAGLGCALDPDRGLDHGAWAPLMLAYPDARVPTTQLSVQPGLGAAHHLALGRALAPLRDEGVLVLASGGATHNLGEFGRHPIGAPPVEYARAFDDWLAEAVEAGRAGDVADYRNRAPHGARNHPSEEHFLPLLVAMGAGGPGAKGRRLHASFTYGVLSMAAFAFG